MFHLKSDYQPTGDQPQAIDALVEGVERGFQHQVLLGVTGSGKTFTMANVIQRLNRPTLVIAHNKTLAAQLAAEFREFFPDNAVGYFVSYYDYYQPEAYIPSTDTFIEKDSSINDEIDRMRHSATAWLSERRDVIIVASVSCIYGLGDPAEYEDLSVSIREGMRIDRDELLRRLVEIQYTRNDFEQERGSFRVRGDVVEILPAAQNEKALRIEFFGDEIDRISEVEVVSGAVLRHLAHVMIFPASHYAIARDKLELCIQHIEDDLRERIQQFRDEGKLLEAQRLEQRTRYDIEMLREIGYCSGIENYSRYFDGRMPGEAPFTLLDYFPKDFLVFIDESHQTLPQLRAMYNGDAARKQSLVEYGFRLPAAFDNRPLKFHEFEAKTGQRIYVSATPGPYEMENASQVVEQIIRPTGLLDPEIVVRPATGQVDDLVGEIRQVVEGGQRVLVTTLTKRMAESLTSYLRELEIRVEYLHSDVETLERIKLIRGLRTGEFDVLVGINLLREGLDMPEVSLVAILDADKEGFLRSETSLIQTIGRAARNVDGRVIMYADNLTDSMLRAIQETNRRRAIQNQYNEEHGITPQTVRAAIRELMEITRAPDRDGGKGMSEEERLMAIDRLEEQMLAAAGNLDFEKAAKLRDQMLELRGEKPMKTGEKSRPSRRRHKK
ncbi:MAG TPA: excinuclease ABC subunit UvrB [Candidatus Pullichristensenella excrementigallinarum]|uniref:UvrABC system protein B n=1 Tax=Candidatus Pullichristensenella excrementigallinarum TaxID=2840907 RepID=A0A9D1LBX3_9FIRM|nr:excinuclease ABC subunit UvrB [Candidatus Pullichristensenella excrementigallinarum]